MNIDTGIVELGLSVRTYNRLNLEGVKTVRDLVSRTETDLLGIRNFGLGALEEVKSRLAGTGFRLKPETTINLAPTRSLRDAVANFVEAFSAGDVSCEIATSLNCTEVEALAGLLRAAGSGYAADYWIEDHAVDDDCGDQHCRCDECKDE
ncbi:DNA-directed RNA polymerase subunit alpha C-terminal domain-containing protein [Nocardia abscessus]|uniref:DNA-directed RNA polymerase subunit alpha C-terminal domain-containing protein n=1 Tax=Nocardia abscessus TaxID=120957 RepID=UPI003CC7FC55